jgi:single-stranded-DNA-specific exonuclease
MPRDYSDTAFLGVEVSMTGRRWVGPGADVERLAEAMVQATSLSEALCRCLVQRGVAPEAAGEYLAPTLRRLLPDPLSLRDAGVAAARIVDAVQSRQAVAIFADYDVDGAASAAILAGWLRDMGVTATIYVPDRLTEGYGPNVAAMARLAKEHDLIVCVDCGTLAHDAIASAHEADVIVLDHHLGADTLPQALAVVNPNRADEDRSLGHLCAAGVVFLVLVEANRQLRGLQDVPDLMASLDLVALATVTDVAPLFGVNRALVVRGLEVMRLRRRPGLVALSDIARLHRPPDADHLGFVLGPRINAGGRIGDAGLGARLLTTQDGHEATALAERLEALNAERRTIEASVRQAALEQISARERPGPLAWAIGEGWHPGVVGIVASRLKETTGCPSVVIALDGEVGVGSGRSVEGIDLGSAIKRLADEGLVERGGGHRMAAGLSVRRDRVEMAMRRLEDLLARVEKDAPSRDLRLDALVFPQAASADFVRSVAAAGPFGAGSPAPRFALSDLRVRRLRRVGDGHLSLNLTDDEGREVQAIAFRAGECGLAAAIEAHCDRKIHVAGRLEVDFWRGRERVQLRLEDAASA